jgi:predicted aldo/keto reductase-like oxidoreductase
VQYRKFGKLDLKPSLLGFGCMRLPIIDGDSGRIKEAEAIKMIRYAIDNGVTYIDTAYPYHKGNSEPLVGKALQDGYREKVYLATKLPIWLTNTYEDFDKYLNEQLEKLGTDHIDFYLLHALNEERWVKLQKIGVFDFLEKAISEGKIKYAGFSFHDELDLFKEIVDAYDWTFCQIQLNYMDENYQAGIKGLKYAASKDLAIIVMEPLKGGKLVNPPDKIKNIWDRSQIKRTPAEWALRWVCNFPEVSVVLSGMSNLDQVIENIVTVEKAFPNSLTGEELDIINEVKNKYIEMTRVNCTNCEYCMPCPAGVNIPQNFTLYNDVYMYDALEHSSFAYNNLLKEENRASSCVDCRKCEKACPQNIPISKILKDIHIELSK